MTRTTNNAVARPHPNLTWPLFWLGIALLAIAVFFGAWGFKIGCLTDSRRTILAVFLPMAVGFGSWCFSGSISANARKLLPGIIIAATGGFAAWLITLYVVIPRGAENCGEPFVDIQRLADFSNVKCDGATVIDKLTITDTILQYPFRAEQGAFYVATARRDSSRNEAVTVYGWFDSKFEEVPPVRPASEATDTLEYRIPLDQNGKAVVRYQWINVNRNDRAHQGVVFTSRYPIRNLALKVISPTGNDINKETLQFLLPPNAGGACSRDMLKCHSLNVTGEVNVDWQWISWPLESCENSATN